MARTVRRPQAAAPLALDDVPALLEKYLDMRKTADEFQGKVDEMKKLLSTAVDTHGFVDDKGNRWIEFEEPIEGVTALKRERRVSRSLDPVRAETVLKRLGLWEECTEEVRVIDEDKILGAGFEGRIKKGVLDSLWTESESWAFKPERRK
jgi:hypothetical protein